MQLHRFRQYVAWIKIALVLLNNGFECPSCGNQKDFQKNMLAFGIYIPIEKNMSGNLQAITQNDDNR